MVWGGGIDEGGGGGGWGRGKGEMGVYGMWRGWILEWWKEVSVNGGRRCGGWKGVSGEGGGWSWWVVGWNDGGVEKGEGMGK